MIDYLLIYKKFTFTYAYKKKVIFDRVNDKLKVKESFSVKLVFIRLEVSSYNLS